MKSQQENLNWFSCYFILFSFRLPERADQKGKHKRTTQAAPFLVSSRFHFIFIILLYTITKTAYTITEPLILSRKLTGSFRVRIRVLPESIDFCLIVQQFPCLYPSFRDNNQVLLTSINYQAKEPQNNRSCPPNVKKPSKAHKNNVIFKAM